MSLATEVKERPILFSGEMVKAILLGRKTQTRRPVKPQPQHQLVEVLGHVTYGMDAADDGAVWYDADCVNPGREVHCPYGRVGERLWVRETWAKRVDVDENTERDKAIHYLKFRADGDDLDMEWHSYGRWRPSIHMPRWASRITLEITGVRVERLQSISEEDAKAEGVHVGQRATASDASLICTTCGQHRNYHAGTSLGCPRGYGTLFSTLSYRGGFEFLWKSINGRESWAENPWVWVIEFKSYNARPREPKG